MGKEAVACKKPHEKLPSNLSLEDGGDSHPKGIVEIRCVASMDANGCPSVFGFRRVQSPRSDGIACFLARLGIVNYED